VILVGELALWVALLMAAWGAIVSFAGASSGRSELVASGERALYAGFACLVLATAGLLVALVTSDFSFRYVASATSANLPIGYKVTALWAGQAGALLCWALIVSTYAAFVVAANQTRNRAFMPYVSGTLLLVLLFVLLVLCFDANPYERVVPIPGEGRGMNPELQNPAVAVHPPSLTLGFAATAIPFAFAIAALLVRQIDDGWLMTVRRWGAVSWFFMTTGLISGMWWAYVEPRRPGDWLPPSFSLVPWLVATAFLLLVTRQAQRGNVRTSNVALIVSTFLLALIAAYLSRGGGLTNGDTSAPSALGDGFAALLLVSVVSVCYLVVARLRSLRVKSLENSVGGESRSGVVPRVRAGLYALYAGAAMFLIACTGFAFGTERNAALSPGESVTLVDPYRREWTFTSQGVSDFPELNRAVEAIPLRVTREDAAAGLILTERRQYVDSRGLPTFEPSIEAGIDHSILQDTYVVLTDITADRVTLRIAFHPLMMWAWIGGVAIAIGGTMVMWPATFARGGRA
jgi:cytochrome c biogenesis factor